MTIHLTNKEGKSYVTFMCFFMTLFVLALLLYGKLTLLFVTLFVIFYFVFFQYSDWKVNSQFVIVNYPFRPFKRHVEISITEIYKVIYRLDYQGISGYPMLSIRLKKSILTYGIRLVKNSTEFEDFITCIATSGEFKVISLSNNYEHVKQLLSDINRDGHITFGK